MRRCHRAGLALLAAIGLAGCVASPGPFADITPERAAAELETGRPLLACREACLEEWRRVQPQAAQLAEAARWRELAATVLHVGYQDDLSLYYLGRAAEGLGYLAAAASYYRQSQEISGTSLSCAYMSRQCGGVALPAATSAPLAAIERTFARPRYRRGRAPAGPSGNLGTPEPAAAAIEPAATPLATQPVLPVFIPPIPALPAPFIAPPPPLPTIGPPPNEFIEPPPAQH